MAELAQRLRLDLANALPRDGELLAHLFQRPASAVFEAEAKLEHTPLARRQRREYVLDLLLEQLVRSGFRRRERAYADYKKAVAWEEANMTRLIHSARTGKPFSEKSAARATPTARAPAKKRRWFQMPRFPSL